MDPALLLFAFTAGAAAFFAPCCVAMLPAYVGYAVRPGTSFSSPMPPATAGAGKALALLGALPLVAGAGPLAVEGIGAFVSIPYGFRRLLPEIQVSIGLFVLGAALIAAGLVLSGRGRAALRGAAFGALATAGFLVVFLSVGVPIAFAARHLAPYVAWLAVTVGAALAIVGVAMLSGQSFGLRLPTLGGAAAGARGFFLFGVGYGIASLSCTFPVFLAVIATGLVSGGFGDALAMFAAYTIGKGVLLVAVTVLTVAGGATFAGKIRRAVPAMKVASALLLIVSGAYIAWYYGRFAPGVG